MAKTLSASGNCPMEIGLNILSGRWRLKILWQLSAGAVHFNELQRRLEGITPKSLARELRELEAEGIVRRTVFPDSPPSVEYALTELGKSVRPVFDALCAWGRDYRAAMKADKAPDSF